MIKTTLKEKDSIMNIILKKMSAFLIAAGTLSSMAASIDEGVSAAAMSSVTYTCNSTYIPGKTSFPVAISKSDGAYYLADTARNICFVKNATEGNRFNLRMIPQMDAVVGFSSSPDDQTKQMLATLYHVEGVYDWYAVLGYSNFGASGNATLYVSLLDAPGTAFSDVSNLHKDGNVFNNDASNLVPFSMVAFGQKGQASYQKLMSGDRDIVGHEMTHIVVKKKLGWYTDMGVETQALMEAYCDILGELSDDNSDWKIGNDSYTGSYCVRDLANPAATRTPNENGALMASNFYTNYALFKSDLEHTKINSGIQKELQRTSAALGSTVISHTAYLMNKYGISRSDLAQIWYRSLTYYGSSGSARTASFGECRDAVTIAANNYFRSKGYSAKKRMSMLEIINDAFDSANIYTVNNKITYPLTYTDMRQYAAANSTNMSNFVRAESQKYPNGKYWNGDDINTYASAPLDTSSYTQNNGITVCPTFYQGYNTDFDYANEEAYFECAGFAKKLQMDYFGTTKFLQLTNGYGYTPRIGDHLRVARSVGPSSTGHSIFITSVSGSRITYADCNAGGDNKIAWNKTGIITRNSDGTTSITLGSTSYKYVWVERPIMLGDVNGDSCVNQNDVAFLKQIVSRGKNYSPYRNVQLTYRNFAADLNKDGKLDNTDVNLLTTALQSTSGIQYELIK